MNTAPTIPKVTSSVDRLAQAVTVATVVAFMAQVFGSGTRGTAIVFVLVIILYYFTQKILAGRPEIFGRFHNLPLTSSGLIALILFAILAGALLRQHSVDSKAVDIGEV